ncbi:putative ribonuclease H-like domain-containing protein [Tanacetum coccineum]
MMEKNEYTGRMPTKVKLTLDESQQGVSDDVLVSIEGVKELKRNICQVRRTYQKYAALPLNTISTVGIKRLQRLSTAQSNVTTVSIKLVLLVLTTAYAQFVLLLIKIQLKDQGLGSTSGIRACALRNFDLEVMEFESAQNNTTAKLPILKLGEYEMWVIRIKQYFQVQDYALWEVIENGNSWVPVPEASQDGSTSVTKMTVPDTAKEKICKKNDVKARSLLLMALPNEHQLTFSQYTDAKTLFAAIETRFERNEATKKTQKALLNQQYENFNASSSESLDSIFNRLQKIVSRLSILSVVITSEDLNAKFLRSLPPEWNTHVVVWMNKADLGTLSIDDFTSSTNNVNTANTDVSTVSTNVNTASPKDDIATLSDSTVYAFLSNQPKGSQLVHEDLEQINDDDLEEMDLKWQLTLLSMRARRFYQKTGRKITIDGSDTAGFDKTKVECYNCHKMGHFVRECKAPRSKDGQYRYQDNSRNQESSKRTMNVEDTSSKAMLAINGIGFDWSDMAEEQVQTNMTLMAFSNSKVYTDKSCSKTCLKNYETLKKQCDDLIVKLNDSEFKTTTYKRGLATIEDQLVTYKKNEVLFCEEIVILKREVGCKEYELGVLRTELEKVKKEKENIDFKITKFDKSAKDLDEMLESQRSDKNKQGLGYNDVAPPYPLIYNRPTKLDLSYLGLDEFKEPKFNGYGPRETVLESTKECDKESENSKENTDDSFEKEQVSDSEYSYVESSANVVKETIFHTAKKVEVVKPKINEKPVKKTVRFTWVFFLATKDETSEILKKFIIQIKNLVDQNVKIIRCDNGTEFKNKVMDKFCKEKGIKREFSVARTPQQNGVAERRNRTLIEAARTMLADSKLPTTFWAEAVSTACYVQNRVLIVKPHNKTPYELFRGIKPTLSFMKPFGCHVTILNTLDNLGKFDGKSDEGFFVGYSLSSKAFRVYNIRTKKVEENLHIGFLENKPMIDVNGPKWMFDIDSLTQSMNYVPVTAGTSTNESAGTQENQNAVIFQEKGKTSQECIVMPIWKDASYFDSSSKTVGNDEPMSASDDPKHVKDGPSNEDNGKDNPGLNTGGIGLNTVGSPVNTATPKDIVGPSHSLEVPNDESFHDEDDTEVDLGNILQSYIVPATPHKRVHINHPLSNMIGDIESSVQTRRMKEPAHEQGFLSAVYEAKPHEDLHTCLFACFLSQEEPKRISKALSELAWVEAMQEELLQFKLQKVWILVDLPKGHRAIGHTQEEGIDYDEVFAPVARIEAIRLFLAYASFMGFMVYQMNMKSAFLYSQIEEEVYVCQPLGFEDPDYPNKVYRVMKALYSLHQAPRVWYETLANYLLGNGFHRGKIGQTLFIKREKGDILLVQIYVDDIIFGFIKKELCTEFKKLMKDKFQMNVKPASTLVDLEKPLVKDGDGTYVDEHLYRSMIGSLMYLTASRPDIMFVVCACARFQVTPKASHLLAVKRIFRYLKGKPTLGLWYSRHSLFELVAYTDSDYTVATQDRKSTTGGVSF